MTDTTRPDGVEAIMELAESYCEKRHTLGAPEYNVVTARARDTLRAAAIAALTAPASKPAGITEAFERLVQEYTGRDMAYHQRNKTTGLDFARRAFEAGVSFAKPAEGGVVEALNNLIHAINWRAGVYASGSSQEKMAFADEQMWKAVDAGKAALAREAK